MRRSRVREKMLTRSRSFDSWPGWRPISAVRSQFQTRGLRSITAQALEATLDGLATGVYLTDRSGRIVFMNRAAEDQIKSSKVLRILNGRLICAPVDSLIQFSATGPALPQLIVKSRHGTAIVPLDFPVRQVKDGRKHICMRPTTAATWM